MKNEELKNCPQCPNHCPRESLMCGRGKAFFEGGAEEKERPHKEMKPIEKMSADERVLHYLRKCGHALHHNPDLAASNPLAALSSAEKSALEKTLAKLIESWESKN